jgi:hypothetical protein
MKFKGETYTWMLKTLWERKEREKWLEREREMARKKESDATGF